MMFNLLYKELRLAAHPNLFIFTCLGVLVIVPAYPYGMIFIFGCLAPFITFMYGRETNDIYYTALLPVKKRDTVKAKCLLLVLAQMTQLLISLHLRSCGLVCFQAATQLVLRPMWHTTASA